MNFENDHPVNTVPRVSIIVAAYNCEYFLPETLRSIHAQTFDDWECIVIDDGSKDGTLAVATRLAAADRRIRVASQANTGAGGARNRALGLLDPRSQYIVCMDSDDLWIPNALEILMREIENHPEAAGAHALGRCIDQNGDDFEDPAYSAHGSGRFYCDKFGHVVNLDPSEPTTFKSLWFSNPFPPGLILARRAAYEKAGLFDTGPSPEDWDMLIRVARHGDIRFVDQVILSYRRHPSNNSGRSAAFNRQIVRNLRHKTFFARENNDAQKRIVRENWRASQLLHLRQKWHATGAYLARARFVRAATALASVCVNFCRFVRGYPTLRGI